MNGVRTQRPITDAATTLRSALLHEHPYRACSRMSRLGRSTCVDTGFFAVPWGDPCGLGYGDAGTPGLMRMALAAKWSALTKP